MKSLIVYFSRSGMNYMDGKIKNIEIGNTKKVALKLKSILKDADIFEIEEKDKYPIDYKECVQRVTKEYKENITPELNNYLASIDIYDKIYLLYPNWCGTIPRPIKTFLEHYDFSKKIINPICTNEGSGMGRSEIDIKKICKNSTVRMGLPLIGHEVDNCDDLLIEWLDKLK